MSIDHRSSDADQELCYDIFMSHNFYKPLFFLYVSMDSVPSKEHGKVPQSPSSHNTVPVQDYWLLHALYNLHELKMMAIE
jgi:hypothetical protein